ncbi:MAG: hypothetical protein OSJ74_05050 [Clostridia bacterium]|nr:hypothetical protein [Clostridia bacterium]
MKKKILISALVVVLLLSMTMVLFTGCGFKPEPLEDFSIPEVSIGIENQPTNTEKINSKMSAFKMLEVATRNFYNAEYAIVEYKGGVNMRIGGAFPVDQEVQSTKIRRGKGDAAGNNANGATYFADNKSYSNFAKLYEKIVISPEKIQWRNADGTSFKRASKKQPKDIWTVDKWNDIDSDFTSIAKEGEEKSFLNKKSNNPTVLWMYDLQEKFIKGQLEPVYDEATKTYRFALEFDPVESTKEYIKTMKAQLEGNAGMTVEGLEFLQLQLEVVLWENGTFRSITVKEGYKMTMAVTPSFKLSNNIVKLTATQQFSYNANEEGFAIDTYVNNFSNENDLKK